MQAKLYLTHSPSIQKETYPIIDSIHTQSLQSIYPVSYFYTLIRVKINIEHGASLRCKKKEKLH
jgi:hypothetical protein